MIVVGTLAMGYADFNTELENLAMLQELNTLHDSEKSLQLFNALMWQCDDNSITTVHKKNNEKCQDRDGIPSDLSVTSPLKYAATGYPIATIRASIKPQPGTAILVDNFAAQQAGRIPSYAYLNAKTVDQVISSSFNTVIDSFTKNGRLKLPETEVSPLKFLPYHFRGILQASYEHTSSQIMNSGSENNLFIATDDGFQAWDVIPSGQSAFINQQGVSDPHTREQLSM